jgi:hypothetical protein
VKAVLSADSAWLARQEGTGRIHLETLVGGKEVGVLPSQHAYDRMRLTRDGSKLGARAMPGDGIDVWDLRLIGERLAKRGQRQDWPTFPPAAPPGEPPRRHRLEVVEGERLVV